MSKNIIARARGAFLIGISLMLAACTVADDASDGRKKAWTSFMLPGAPADGYMSSTLLERDISPDAPIVAAMTRHKEICETGGCPEWEQHVEKIRKKTENKTARYTVWYVHEHFRRSSYISQPARFKYGSDKYFASPAEFFANGKAGDVKAVILAEIMTLRELGWDENDIRFTLIMIGRHYVPVAMVRHPDIRNGAEYMLYPTHEFGTSPDFRREAALIYSTNGSKLWEQEWVRNKEYALTTRQPLVNTVTGDRTRTSLFY